MTVDYQGNVGIGTTGPDAKLAIRGGDGSSYISGITLGATGGNVYAMYPTVNDLRFRSVTAGSDIVTFAYAGNVGIGTTIPTQKLDVVGNGKFSGKVTSASTSSSDSGITLTTKDYVDTVVSTSSL